MNNEQHLRKEIHKFTSAMLSQMSEEQLNKLNKDLQEDSDMVVSSALSIKDILNEDRVALDQAFAELDKE